MKFKEVPQADSSDKGEVCLDSGWQHCDLFNKYCSHIYSNDIYSWFMKYHCCQHCVKRQEELDRKLRECQDSNLVECSNYRQYCHHIGKNLKYTKFMKKHCCAFCTDPNIDTWVIHGHIHFDKTPGVLPPNSCLQVTLWKSRRPATFTRNKKPVAVETMKYNLEGVKVSDKYQYWFIIDRIHESMLFPRFYLTAALNVGWCGKQKGRVTKMGNVWRKGDYRMEKR